MARRNWKHVRALSLIHAMELCVEHARQKFNRDPARIAELMGLNGTSSLYKWLSNGRMPANLIRVFEHACGTDFVTEYMAYSANKLILDMPTGRRAEHRELNELGSYTNKVMAMLIDFYDAQSDQDQVLSALTMLMEDLAHQRGNIEKYQQPELL